MKIFKNTLTLLLTGYIGLAVIHTAYGAKQPATISSAIYPQSGIETATTQVVTVQEATTAATETTTPSTTEEGTQSATEAVQKKTLIKNGWVKKNSKKYYYVKGKKVTGWKKINGKKYYFNKNGVLQTSKMISKNKYVNQKGQLVNKKYIYKYGKSGLKKLKTKITNEIKGYSGTWSVYVKNLDTNEYMVINNTGIRAASLIKLYNMGAIYSQIQKKKLKETSNVKSNLNSMITVSSNDSYNLLLSQLGNGNTYQGINVINSFCKKNGYKDTTCGGTLYPSYCTQYYSGASLTTVRDCGHILEDIYRGTLVNQASSNKMLKLLKSQTRTSKIPSALPSGVKTANKTGETDTRQHDAAIVFSKKADYIIVIMTENDGASIGHIRTISRMTYDYFN